MSPAVIVQGDARALPLPDDSVDLVVTSPPYWGLRDYGVDDQLGAERTMAEYLDNLIEATAEMVRVLKPSGSLWVVLGDKYASRRRGPNDSSSKLTTQAQHRPTTISPRFDVPERSLCAVPQRFMIRCIDELRLVCRQDVIWSKTNGMPESVDNRCLRTHEVLLHFTLAAGYYANVDEVRLPHAPATAARARAGFGGKYVANGVGPGNRRSDLTDGYDVNPLGALPPSVWTIPTAPLIVPSDLEVLHFAAFPLEIPRRVISGWCPPGGVVLDPFAGTGTTVLAAAALGRVGVGVELRHDYCRLARWRTTDPVERARALLVPRPAAQVNGQGDLFSTVLA